MPTPKRVKYPRTPHLPWSPGRTGDDILLDSVQHLENLKKIRACWRGASFYGEEQEGYVVRNAAGFSFADFKFNVAKFVRASHVQTTKHLRRDAIISNQLAKNSSSPEATAKSFCGDDFSSVHLRRGVFTAV
jgi:hypothetical protein